MSAAQVLNEVIKSKACLEKEEKKEKCKEFLDKYFNSLYKNKNVEVSSEKKILSPELIFELINIKFIKLSSLRKIKHSLMITEDSSIKISNLFVSPWNFLNQEHQLLSLNQIEQIINFYNLDSDDWKRAAPVAFSFDYLRKQNSFYCVKYSKVSDNKSIYYNLREKNVTLNLTGTTRHGVKWYLYDPMEEKYNEFRDKWHLVEWNPSDLMLKEITDNDREKKELKKHQWNPKIWKVPYGKYWTTQRFMDIESEMEECVLDLIQPKDKKLSMIDIIDNIKCVENKLKTIFTKKQKKAIINFFTGKKFQTLTGFPGSGKSTIVNAIQMIHSKNFNQCYKMNDEEETECNIEKCWLVLAPTGKALNNIKTKLSNSEHIYFFTIAKFLYYILPKFKSYVNDEQLFYNDLQYSNTNEDKKNIQLNMAELYYLNNINPFENVIIDECSMIGTENYLDLLKCFIDFDTNNILNVGDPNQLPSISPGNPFEILIKRCQEYELQTQTELNEILRNEGAISQAVVKMASENKIDYSIFDNKTMIFVYSQPHNVCQTIINILKHNPEYKLGYNCSILSPINGDENEKEKISFNGSVCNINYHIQNYLNPITKENVNALIYYEKEFRNGDLFIRIKNDYQENQLYANGECGKIIIGPENFKNNNLLLVYDDKREQYISLKEAYEEIRLSYAMTIHKKQGDEDDIVFVVVNKNHSYSWGDKNEDRLALIFTAISRAKKKCIVIGDMDTFENIFNQTVTTKYTKFMENLDGEE